MAPDIVTREPGGDLTSDMMKTLVANGNDALGLLVQAAGQSDASSFGHNSAAAGHRQSLLATASAAGEASVRFTHPPPPPPPMSNLHMWRSFRFVRMGWFTSEEAVMYINL